MSTFTLHSKADIHNISSSPRTFLHLRECLPNEASRVTQCFLFLGVPLQTNDTKAKVSHITRVESKSISYHAFSLSFHFSLFLPTKTRIKKTICRNLHSNSDATFAWRTDKASENDTLQYVETTCRRNKQRRMQFSQSAQQKESELRNSRSCHICLKKQAEKNAACTVSSAEGV
ncbi:hypothetical protein ACFX2K_042396 [Malus domestica]